MEHNNCINHPERKAVSSMGTLCLCGELVPVVGFCKECFDSIQHSERKQMYYDHRVEAFDNHNKTKNHIKGIPEIREWAYQPKEKEKKLMMTMEKLKDILRGLEGNILNARMDKNEPMAAYFEGRRSALMMYVLPEITQEESGNLGPGGEQFKESVAKYVDQATKP